MIDENNRMLLKGKFPGVGKSHTVINYKNHKILFVTPFNKLAQETRIKGHGAITANKLLEFYGDGQSYVKMKRFDVSSYDCICFDEIMMHGPKTLQKIDLFMKQYPDKKFFATGDVDQLQPIDFEANNVLDLRSYLMSCINQMFLNQTLKINKRLKTDEQRESLSDLKRDIFDPKKDIMKTLTSAGFNTISNFSDIKSTKNICYFNYRVDVVNGHVNKYIAQNQSVLLTLMVLFIGLD